MGREVYGRRNSQGSRSRAGRNRKNSPLCAIFRNRKSTQRREPLWKEAGAYMVREARGLKLNEGPPAKKKKNNKIK